MISWELMGGDGRWWDTKITKNHKSDKSWSGFVEQSGLEWLVYGYFKGKWRSQHIAAIGMGARDKTNSRKPNARGTGVSFSCRFRAGLLAAFGNSFDVLGWLSRTICNMCWMSFCWHVRSRLVSLFASAFLFWALLLASRTTFRVYSLASASHLDSQVTPGTGSKTL